MKLKTNKIFVYGTLLRNMSNARIIKEESIEWIEDAATKGSLYMVKGARYPAMIHENDDDIVYGEIYSIKSDYLDETIKYCDHLEGHPSFYKREIVTVVDKEGNEHDAYTYNFQMYEMLGEKIENGDFRDAFSKMFSRK